MKILFDFKFKIENLKKLKNKFNIIYNINFYNLKIKKIM